MSPVDEVAPVPVPVRYERATYRALAGESRQALLAVLHQGGGPLDAVAAGASVGLHPNTARVHLEVLCSVGLVGRRTEERSRRGRPRVLYEAAAPVRRLPDPAPPRPTDTGYRELARVLAQQFAERPDVPGETLRAGQRWASALSHVSLPERRLSDVETVAVAVDLLERLGFEPVGAPGAGRIVLHHCPLEDVARESRSVVCGIHLGMLKATVERLDCPLDVVGLEPFVTDEPSACIVKLGKRP